MELRAWKLLDRRTILSCPPWLEVLQERVELPSGRILDDFYRVALPDFVVVVPVTAEGRIVLVRGYKHGLGRVALMAPAGFVSPGEEPEAAARRELLEETGHEADGWEYLGRWVTDSNRECGRMHLYLARGAVRRGAAQEDDSEELEVVTVSREEALAAMRAGEMGTLAGAGALAMALLLG